MASGSQPNYKRIVRFALIGIVNASLSFGLLNLCFYYFGLPKIVSSLISTSVALCISFVFNRIFVFKDKGRKVYRQMMPFILVTITGSIIVLNIIYAISVAVLNRHSFWAVEAIRSTTGLSVAKSFIEINLSTVIGAIGAMIWNYNGYRKFVFNSVGEPDLEESS